MKRGDATDDGLVGWPERHFTGYRKRFTEVDVAALRALLTLRAAAQQVDNAQAAWFAASGLTPQKFSILMLLYSEPEPVALSNLRRFLNTTQANVTGLIAGLERDDLIERRASRTDGRVSFVSLSRSGKRIVAAKLPGYLGFSREALRSLSQGEKKTLVTLLTRVADGFLP
jgi:DNA-binding MarR family transcriptional regulator